MSDLTLKLWVECQLLLEDAKAHLRELERGQGMVEYSLILTLVGIAALLTLYNLGQQVNTRFDRILQCMTNPTAGTCPTAP